MFNGMEIPAQTIISTNHKKFLRAKDPEARQNCLKELANRKDWRAYYAMKEQVADLRFTHASTVHKSQGSTYANVLVMAPNIMTCPGISTRRRLLYVAYTRASQHLHVMTQ
jgi:ATP-dependent exoDNAse (exonuclease V) alpha subunit